MTIMQFPIGDFSGDGHQRYVLVTVETSASRSEIAEAQLIAEDKLPHELSPAIICSEYEDHRVSREIWQRILTMSSVNLGDGSEDEENEYVWVDLDRFAEYIVWMINTELPSEKHLKIVKMPIIALPVYGYGLFT